jgi:protein tyrosine phosphatase
LTHFFYTNWSDFGVPESPTPLLAFIEKVKEKQSEMVKQLGESWSGNASGPPIVVHCSAGMGRTGELLLKLFHFLLLHLMNSKTANQELSSHFTTQSNNLPKQVQLTSKESSRR